ncbi:Uncharacterised protein [Mycobacterium tuberculosis]|nr:Uncharacterised protein [Mycobacterium tuberculosis]
MTSMKLSGSATPFMPPPVRMAESLAKTLRTPRSRPALAISYIWG